MQIYKRGEFFKALPQHVEKISIHLFSVPASDKENSLLAFSIKTGFCTGIRGRTLLSNFVRQRDSGGQAEYIVLCPVSAFRR